jgi:drug/metabolite transporter (DMT)-like permease
MAGILFVLISGCCWGFHGVLIKFALQLGASFLQVFLFETIFATLFFSFFAKSFLRKVRPRSLKEWLLLSAIGIDTIGVGYFLFLAFSLGPVAIGATLMFMYLPVVYGFSLLAGHQKFSWAKILAIGLVLGGAMLTTEILSSLNEPGAISAALAALAASMCYAVVFILTPSVAAYTSAEFRSFAASFTGLIGTLVILAILPNLWFPLTENLWPLFGMACLLGAVGQTLPVITLMKGLPLTGSSLGGVLASIELPIAVFASAILLGESLNPLKVVGVALVLSGIVLYNFSDRNR